MFATMVLRASSIGAEGVPWFDVAHLEGRSDEAPRQRYLPTALLDRLGLHAPLVVAVSAGTATRRPTGRITPRRRYTWYRRQSLGRGASAGEGNGT